MSAWREVTLGELISVKHGYAFKGDYFASQGKEVVLTPGNFPVGGGLQFREGKERYYTGAYPPEFKLSPGQLLVVMTDLKRGCSNSRVSSFCPGSSTSATQPALGARPSKIRYRIGCPLSLLSPALRSVAKSASCDSDGLDCPPHRA